ncbi:hypothetical protein AKJ55_00755 [candidate division MSBL1 archaeon SCGC-AAA382M17]|uniref:Glycosyltransferase RgtA/B/C/D-like domain-containing protein n=1 Tax=candidate division MSBL1 archaeon SCGC-AAA382M17 TaxID=1698284 RepID=A0ABR5TJR6_9EURY|nr:hypothetical protein AKJ55_00755 [candidate division MSBL1 archaeon SCGC-AAA382M17]
MQFMRNLLSRIDRRYLLLIFILMIAGAILRFYQLGSQSVWLDESISAIASKNILETGWPTLPTGEPQTRALLSKVLIAISFGISGSFSTAAGRVPAAIFGVLSIPLAYLLGRKIKNGRVGLILAFLLTFATVQVAWSRQMRMYQQLQFFFLLSLYLLERFLAKTNWRRFIPLLVSVFCMTVSHDAFGYVPMIPILIWLIAEKSTWIWGKITNLKDVEGKDWVGVTLLIVSFATILYLRGIPWGSINRLFEWKVDYGSQYVEHFRTQMGSLFLLAIPGALLGLLERKRNLLYVISLLLPFYVVSNHVLALQHRYVFMLFPLLFIFAAVTLDYLYERVKESVPRLQKGRIHLQPIIPIVVLIVILIPMVSAARFTFIPKSHYNLGRTAPQGEFRPAYGYVEKNWKDNDVVISTLTSVTWYYLQRSDYWISFSHWGFRELPRRDSYTGAEPIRTLENLKTITENSPGWVIIDLMGMSRANTEVLKFIDENFDLIEEVSGGGKGVWIYRWSK